MLAGALAGAAGREVTAMPASAARGSCARR